MGAAATDWLKGRVEDQLCGQQLPIMAKGKVEDQLFGQQLPNGLRA